MTSITDNSVIDLSVLQLVKKLCLYMVQYSASCLPSSPLVSTFLPPTKFTPWSTTESIEYSNTLVRIFYDTVLLRRWEWFGLAEEVSILSPACRCMAFSYPLTKQGKVDEAGRLIDAVSTLSETKVLKEPEAILLFLSLLAGVEVDNTHAPLFNSNTGKQAFQYEIYPSSFFEEPPYHSGLIGMNNELSRSISLFECVPGTGFDNFLSAPTYQEGQSDTLYDGLIHCTVKDLNTSLGLPQLPTSHDDITLMPHTVATHSISSYSSEPGSPPAGSATTTDSVGLLSQVKNEGPSVSRGWEGWHTSSRRYLCEGPESCLPLAVELCLSRHCSLAAVPPSQLEDCGSGIGHVIAELNSLPMNHLAMFEKNGSVSRLFGEAVQSLLDYFRVQLHQIAGGTDLYLSLSSHWILPTVKFLMHIWNDVRDLPKGLELLDALYLQCCAVQGTPHYLLLLNLLARALAPYFKFVEQWVFQGWLNKGEEFGVHSNVEALTRRDVEYWSGGYTTNGGCAPGFMLGQAHTILTCGKALNLLRICKPNHPLCTGMFQPPKLTVQLSLEGLERCNLQCQHYGREVQESEHVRQELFKQEILAKEEELRAELLKARQEARAHAEKLKKLEETYKAQEKEKKAALRDALLEQIKTNQALRTEKEAEEREQDKERLDYLSSREALQIEHQAALQDKAREDMIAYYAELSREAELRRLRAEWRAKRYKLSTRRLEFLRNERETIAMEVEKASKSSRTITPLATPQQQSPIKLHTNTSHKELPSDDHSQYMISEKLPTTSFPQQKSTSEPTVRRTWAESTQDEDTLEHTSRKTWIASMINQPVQVGAGDNVKPATGDLEQDPFQQQDHFSVGIGSDISSSTLQTKLPSLDKQTNDPSTVSQCTQSAVSSYMASGQLSVAQTLLYPTEHAQSVMVQEEGVPRLVSSRGQMPPSTAQDIICPSEGRTKKYVTTRGHAPESTAQDIIYGTDWADSTDRPHIQESGHPRLVSSRGQAPESTAQFKMYPLRYEPKKEKIVGEIQAAVKVESPPEIEFGPSIKYRDNFTFDVEPSSQDMLSAVLGPATEEESDIDTEFLSVYPLSALIEQSLALPILTQSTLVNEALLRYFLTECHIVHHFTVIKWFLLLEDGEFGHALSTRLCEELAHGQDWRVLCSPSFLNPLLSAALEVSVHSRCPEAQRVSFALKYRPTMVNTHAIDAMEFLQLKYKVDWPCNIVITNASIEKYNKILQLLLQMKRASWALKNTFHQLKVCKELTASQSRQLQVYRHEYQHFVNVMHGYIANQVFQITWGEFETDLQNEVHSFEELIKAHHNFINKAIFRCLLSKKAMPVMKLIQNIFSSILKFSSQLEVGKVNMKKSYAAMCETHTRFREVSGLLIKVVDKLVQRGYQPHLEEFLLRLDFNAFYKPCV